VVCRNVVSSSKRGIGWTFNCGDRGDRRVSLKKERGARKTRRRSMPYGIESTKGADEHLLQGTNPKWRGGIGSRTEELRGTSGETET